MRRTLCVALLLTSFAASPAAAHIELLEPTARYPIGSAAENKACPCGVGLSNRLCDIPTDRSDPDRSDRITTFAPGSVITVRFDEYVAHSGRFRIAFDPDGADLADFNANILLDVEDPPGNTGNSGQGSIWELEVTLPDQLCDNCTLQLIQMMDGNTTDPVLDPVNRSSYYACADLVISDTDPGGGTDSGTGGGGCQSSGGSPGAGWALLLTLGLMLGLGQRSDRVVS